MKKRIPLLTAILALVAGLIVAPTVPQAALAQDPPSAAAMPTATNVDAPATETTLPLVPGTGADPDIHTYDGRYYMLYNGDHSGAEVRMRVASSLAGLADGMDVSVWAPPASMTDICCRVGWGGYLFPYEDRWYIYMQGDNGDQNQSRSFVLESANSDPLSAYTFKAYIPGVVNNNGYAAGPALVGDELYMFQTYGEKIWAAKASDPWTLTTGWTTVNAPQPTGWECAGGRCYNEGSNILVRGDTVYNIFSAGGYEDPNYCVGMMTAPLGSDLTLPGSWTEEDGCVISRDDSVGSYGPGSMTWFKSPDGTEDWVAYHVKTSTETTWDGHDRRLMAKKVTWDGDRPVFGTPDAVGSTIALPSGDSGINNAAPAVASASADSISLFTRTGDGKIAESTWTEDGGWGEWSDLGNGGVRAITNPSAVSHIEGTIDLYTTRQDGSIAHSWTTTGGDTWAEWEDFGTPPPGGTTSALSASTWGPNRQNVYVRGGGRIYEKWWTAGSGWSNWLDVGSHPGGTLSAPASAARAPERQDVFVRTSGNNIAAARRDGNNWSSWHYLGLAGGGIVSNPSAARVSADRVIIHGTARDGNVYQRSWTTNGGWTAWENLGAPAGGAGSSPAAVSRSADSIDVFVRDGAGAIQQKSWDGSAWSDWTPVAAQVPTEPEPDTTKPTASLISPSTAGPLRAVELKVDAADETGLQKIVANVYQGGTLVKSTQSAVADGAKTGSHSATLALVDGSYTVRYNAHDLAGNVSATASFDFVVDGTVPTVTVKEGAGFTTGAGGTYDLISYKLHDVGKIDKLTLNGVEKDLSNNAWSDVNQVKVGSFGAVHGENTLVVYDVAGNQFTVTFTLN